MKEIGLNVTSTPIIYGDNQSAQALSMNGIKSERTKHVAIKYAFIYDEVTKGKCGTPVDSHYRTVSRYTN